MDRVLSKFVVNILMGYFRANESEMKFRRRILSPPGDLKRNNGEKRREQNKLGPVEALLFLRK